MKIRKTAALALCLVLAVTMLSGCTSNETKEPTVAERYQQAAELLQAGQLSEAADAFTALGHYGQATQYGMYCKALSSAKAGSWAEAALTLQTLGDFLDSPILAAYYQGRALEDAERYEEALAAYGGLQQFDDVSARTAAIPGLILARDYRAAEALETAGNLQRALSAFEALGSYSDSAARAQALRDRLTEADYQNALALEGADDAVGAYNAFKRLGTYQDSADRAAALEQEAAYRNAFTQAEAGNYRMAQTAYASLGDYKDAAEKVRLLQAPVSGNDTHKLADGVYRFRMNGLYGFVDLNNNRDIQPFWKGLNAFDNNGLAIAQDVNSGDSTLVNLRGQQMTRRGYSEISYLNSALYLGRNGSSWRNITYDLLNAQGEVLETYRSVQSFSEGMAAVQSNSDGKWGYIDEKGNVVIQPAFAEAKAFSEGLAPVAGGNAWGFIDKTGAWKLEPAYGEAWGFSGGLALVRTKDDGMQMIGKEGELVLFKESVYQSADALDNSQKYEEAIAKFESLGGYADSADRAAASREKINQQVYARAESLLAKGDLEQAASTFEWLGEYSDAAARAEEVRETIRANTYARAQALEEQGRLEQAIEIYLSLGDYQGSAAHAAELREGINQSILAVAVAFEEQKEYMLAFVTLVPIAEWSDVPQRIANLWSAYLQGMVDEADALETAGQFEQAQEKFRNIHDEIVTMANNIARIQNHETASEAEAERLAPAIAKMQEVTVGADAEERISALEEKIHQRDYAAAAELETKLQFTEAITAFTALGDYSDAADRAAAAQASLTDYQRRYGEAAALEKELRFQEAADAFTALTTFSDSADRAATAQASHDSYQAAYDAAGALETEEKFEAAVEAFGKLNGWGDSAARITALEGKILARDYAAASALEDEGRFDEAYAAFIKLGAYEDSADRAAQVEVKAIQQANEKAYAAAEALESESKFEEAAAAFAALGEFSDSADRAAAAQASLTDFQQRYAAAEALETALKFDEAIPAFNALIPFSDSAARSAAAQASLERYQAAYNAAAQLESENKLEEAKAAFEALTTWSDAQSRVAGVVEKIHARDYELAKAAIEREDYVEALRLLGTLGNLSAYEDGGALMLLADAETGTRYQQALEDALNGRISKAYDGFVALGEYRDSAAKATILGNLSHASKTQQITTGVLIYEFHELWGLANLNTNIFVPAKYTSIKFEDKTVYQKLNLMQVYIKKPKAQDCTYGYINLNGEEVVPCQFYAVSDFDEKGNCTVAKAMSDKIYTWGDYMFSRLYYGIYNKDGAVVTKPQWRTMGASTNSGRSGSRWEATYYESWQLSGNAYHTISLPTFTDGRMKVQSSNDQGLWGYIGEDGKVLGAGVKWTNIGDFSGGMAMVMDANQKYGFIDDRGNQVGEVRWEKVKSFSNGYAAVLENGKWGFIDTTNTLVIPCRYTEVNDFKKDGTCDVKTSDGTWVIINTSGENVFFGN